MFILNFILLYKLHRSTIKGQNGIKSKNAEKNNIVFFKTIFEISVDVYD